MDDTELTPEQLPYILNAGVMHIRRQDGAGSGGYVYTYTFGTTSQTTIDSYTIEAGDDQQEEEFPGACGILQNQRQGGDPLDDEHRSGRGVRRPPPPTPALSYPDG